jgi:hypothetical protein
LRRDLDAKVDKATADALQVAEEERDEAVATTVAGVDPQDLPQVGGRVARLAVTGHRGLSEATTVLVDAALRREIGQRAEDGPLVGLSCIADGADALFARAILDHGGALHVIVPARGYRDALPEEHHPTYDALIAAAVEIIRLDHVESDSRAHMDASLRMLAGADELLAVWDGEPARGPGGTADVVGAARDRGMPVTVVWPVGATRD